MVCVLKLLSSGNGDAEALSLCVNCFLIAEEAAMYHDFAPFDRDHLAFKGDHPLQGQHGAEADIQVADDNRVAFCPGGQPKGFVHYGGNGAAVGMPRGAFGPRSEPDACMQVLFRVTVVTDSKTVAVRFTGDKAERVAHE